MSRVGKLPVKLPPGVTVRVEEMDPMELPPIKPFLKARMRYALRNRPSRDGFAAFGTPSRVFVEGPLGRLQLPVHSYVAVAVGEDAVTVEPQCGGETKMGKTLWGTTRGYISNMVRGVSQGFRKDLELKGVGFKARVEPATTAAPPAGERVVQYRLGTERYGHSPRHKQPGPLEADVQPGPFAFPSAVAAGRAPGAENRTALMLRIGFSHEVRVDFPPHLTVTTPSPTTISISGADAQQVGLAAQRVRLLRKPDVYKGKGVRYVGEKVRLRQGKRK
jgi:large subunit ribosomal protein L6